LKHPGLRAALDLLERAGDRRTREGYARYGIVAPKSLGVPMAKIQAIAKKLGTDHALALALWETGWYEARLLCAFVGDPARLTAAQMERWTKDFDNWGVCDTLCFKLYDRSPLAWKKLSPWAKKKDEFVRRAAFALLASLALHDKAAKDAAFVQTLPLIEKAANDERNFVKKGVSWALRSIGRRNAALRVKSVALAKRLAASDDPAPRWIGKDALRELTR
jgi:3-methyladenine DNA glycosylase AlkD